MMEMDKDFKLKQFQKFRILIGKIKDLGPNLKQGINLEHFYVISPKINNNYAKKREYIIMLDEVVYAPFYFLFLSHPSH